MWLGCTSPRAADLPPLTEFFRPSMNIHDNHTRHIHLFGFPVNAFDPSDPTTEIPPVVAIDIGAGSGYKDPWKLSDLHRFEPGNQWAAGYNDLVVQPQFKPYAVPKRHVVRRTGLRRSRFRVLRVGARVCAPHAAPFVASHEGRSRTPRSPQLCDD